MPEPAPPFSDQVNACTLGALAGDPGAAEELIAAAICVGESGGHDLDALRAAGLGTAPPGGGAAVILRALPYALVSQVDRPRLRRGAHRIAALAHVDEGAVVAAVAVAVLASDLARGFDLDTALMRCHQTLLEEAPMALLTRLRPLADDAEPGDDSDPTVALQLAVTALSRNSGVDAVVASVKGAGRSVAPALAGALAGIRDGFVGFDVAPLREHPLHERAGQAAQALVTAAVRDAAATPSGH